MDITVNVKCVQCKLDIAGTGIEMHLFVVLVFLVKRPYQTPVAHFDQKRTTRYHF